jgi:hypothetical protein
MLAALLLVALAIHSDPDGPASAAPSTVSTQAPVAPGQRSACIRSLREFAYALSSAVESGDVNRLAALYRWQGLSTRTGYDTMARLQEIVARPLLDVAPVYPQAREREFAFADPDAAVPAHAIADPGMFPPLTGPPMFEVPLPTGPDVAADPGASAGPGPGTRTGAESADDALPRSPPVALRLDQTLANGVTPAATTLRLQRELGCWWVSL